jgi:hypothetical protein
MSKAVFLFTFYRFANLWTFFTLLLFTFGIPIFFLGVLLNLSAFGAEDSISEKLVPLISSLFTAPLLPMLVAYMFVRNSIGNAKSLNDGEYMALLFSRPLTRSSYVMAKWLAGSLAVFMVIICQFVFFNFGLYIRGIASQSPIEFADVANILLNSLGASAFIVMIQSFPPRVGRFVFLSVLYGSFLIPLLISSPSSHNAEHNLYNFQNTASKAGGIVRSFFYPSIDMNSYLDSVHFYWLPIFAFVSNIALYIWIAVWILNRREFFYANE